MPYILGQLSSPTYHTIIPFFLLGWQLLNAGRSGREAPGMHATCLNKELKELQYHKGIQQIMNFIIDLSNKSFSFLKLNVRHFFEYLIFL